MKILIRNTLFGLLIAFGFAFMSAVALILFIPSQTIDLIFFTSLAIGGIFGFLIQFPDVIPKWKKKKRVPHQETLLLVWSGILTIATTVVLIVSGYMKNVFVTILLVVVLMLASIAIFRPLEVCSYSFLAAAIILLVTAPVMAFFIALLLQSVVMLLVAFFLVFALVGYMND